MQRVLLCFVNQYRVLKTFSCRLRLPMLIKMKLLLAIYLVLIYATLQPTDATKNKKWTEKTEDGDIEIEIFREGEDCEKTAEDGDILVLSYHGMMPVSGVEFDNSKNRKRAYHFTLGEGRVMKAWEIGLKGMCKGEQRSLTIPPGPLQKGDKGSGALIPHDDETLMYVFELLSIRSTPPPINMFKEMDADDDNAIQKEEMLAYLKNEGLGGLKDDETVEDVIDTIFQGQDKNEDDVISHDEFSGPKHDEF